MTYTPAFLTFLISHYSKRLGEELEKGNTKAASFLRKTLHELKSNNYSIIN